MKTIFKVTLLIVFLCLREALCSQFGCIAETEPIGCYKDGEINSRTGKRPFVETLFGPSERTPGEPLKDVTCRCATEASKKKYPFFAIKNNGVCLSGPPYSVEFDALGLSLSCMNGQQQECPLGEDVCTGMEDSLYVHRVVYEPCNVTFVRKGCYHDSMIKPRPLPDYILNSRDKQHKGFEEPIINWKEWNKWMPDFICRCANKAKSKGYTMFGVQFFGECWSGENAEETFARDGESTRCMSYDYQSCKPDDELCVGKQKTNFIYSIAEPCDVEYKEIGCYKDKYWNPPRPIPDMLTTEADKHHPLNNGLQILWYKWNKYFPQMICRCAKETFKRKWDTFGVQNYGECFSGVNAVNTFMQDGNSGQCVREDFEACPDGTLNCVGPQSINYVYSVLSCEVEFDVIGCYKDDQKKPRPLPKYILNDRDPRAKATYSGRKIDWKNWDNYLPQFVCRCARKAKEMGFSHFGTQFYGECWAGVDNTTYARNGASDKCIGSGYMKCQDGTINCIGQAKHNYVYRLRG